MGLVPIGKVLFLLVSIVVLPTVAHPGQIGRYSQGGLAGITYAEQPTGIEFEGLAVVGYTLIGAVP